MKEEKELAGNEGDREQITQPATQVDAANNNVHYTTLPAALVLCTLWKITDCMAGSFMTKNATWSHSICNNLWDEMIRKRLFGRAKKVLQLFYEYIPAYLNTECSRSIA